MCNIYRRRSAIAAIICLAGGLSLPASWGTTVGEILLADDFNNENAGFPGVVNYNSFANFDVVDGSVDLIGNGFRDFFPANGLYVDLDGTTRNGADFISKSSFSLEPGERYLLSFHLGNPDQSFGGGSTDNVMTVSLGNAYSETFERSGLVPFELIAREIVVPAATTVQLKFSQEGGDHLGVLIDDIVFAIASGGNADFDGDGEVGATDFLRWQRGAGRFTGDATAEDGDADGDGLVNAADLSVWGASYGHSAAAVEQTASVHSIPEPQTNSVVALAMIIAAGFSRARLAEAGGGDNHSAPRWGGFVERS